MVIVTIVLDPADTILIKPLRYHPTLPPFWRIKNDGQEYDPHSPGPPTRFDCCNQCVYDFGGIFEYLAQSPNSFSKQTFCSNVDLGGWGTDVYDFGNISDILCQKSKDFRSDEFFAFFVFKITPGPLRN